MRIGANPNSLQQDSADEIISKAHLNEIFYDFNPNGTYTVESEVIYHPYELEEVKSEFTNDFKNHQEAKRSGKDIPEQTAMKLFNEHISRAKRGFKKSSIPSCHETLVGKMGGEPSEHRPSLSEQSSFNGLPRRGSRK